MRVSTVSAYRAYAYKKMGRTPENHGRKSPDMRLRSKPAGNLEDVRFLHWVVRPDPRRDLGVRARRVIAGRIYAVRSAVPAAPFSRKTIVSPPVWASSSCTLSWNW